MVAELNRNAGTLKKDLVIGMNIKYMTLEEQNEFWRRHKESKDTMTARWWGLPYDKKVEILEKMKANHEAMRNAKLIPSHS